MKNRYLFIGFLLFLIMSFCWTEGWADCPTGITCPPADTQSTNGTNFQTGNFCAKNPGDTVTSVTATFTGSGVTNVTVVYTVPPPDSQVEGYVRYNVTDHCKSGGSVELIAWKNTVGFDTCSFNIVLTNHAPVITCPNNGSVHAGHTFVSTNFSVTDPNNDSAPVTFLSISPSATHNPTIVGSHVEWVTTCAEKGNYTIRLVATDLCGLKDTCEFTVNVYNQPPVLTCPNSDSVHAGLNFVSSNFSVTDPESDPTVVTFFDISPPATHNPTIVASHVEWLTTCSEANKTYTIRLLATDSCGAKDTCQFTVKVNNKPPVLTCPNNGGVHAGRKFVSSNFSVTDPDGDTAPVTFFSITPPATNNPTIVGSHVEWVTTCSEKGDYVIRLLATDPCGLKDTCEFTVNVYNQPPSLTCPSSDSVHAGIKFVSTNFSVTDPENDTTVVTFISISPSATNSPTVVGKHVEWVTTCSEAGKTYTISLVATDSCGAKDTCQFTVKVYNRPPVLTCPNNGSVHAGRKFVSTNFLVTDPDGDTAPVTFFSITPPATNNPTIVGSHVEWVTTCSEKGDYVIRLLATDPCGLKDTCEFTVDVYNQPPVLTCPNSDSVHAGLNFVSSNFSVTDPESDPTVVTFFDISPPATHNPTIVASHVEWLTTCIEANKTYTIRLLATDSCGAKDTCQFTVKVYNRPPVLTCPTNGSVHAGRKFVSTNFSVTDPDGDTAPVTFFSITPPATYNPTIVGSHVEWVTTCSEKGDYVIRLLATDPCGLKDTCEFTVEVLEHDPVLTCPAYTNIHARLRFVSADFSVSDSNSDVAQVTFLNITPPSKTYIPTVVGNHVEWQTTCDDIGNFVIKLVARDSCSNADTCSFTVTAYNNLPYANTSPPWIEHDSVVFLSAEPSQDLDLDTLTFHWHQILGKKVKVYPDTVTRDSTVWFIPPDTGWYKFSLWGYDGCDNSNNAAYCSVRVSPNNQPPQFTTCPNNGTVHAGHNFESTDFSATDPNPGDSPSVTILNISPTATNNPSILEKHVEWVTTCAEKGDYFIRLLATDNGGLKDTCEFKVTVTNQPPNITTCPKSDTVYAGRKFLSNNFSVSDPEGDRVTVSLCGINPTPTHQPSPVSNHVEWQTACADTGKTFTICLLATDSCGAKDTCYFQVTVNRHSPQLTCPKDSSVHAGDTFKSNDFEPTDSNGDVDSVKFLNITPQPTHNPSIVGSHVEWVTTSSEVGKTYTIYLQVIDSCKASSTCSLRVNVLNTPPQVNIPNQAIWRRGSFKDIWLDTCVVDDDTVSHITWTAPGSAHLNVNISPDRKATITTKDTIWVGFERIVFMATDNGNLSDSDTIIASVCDYSPRALSFGEKRVGFLSGGQNVAIQNKMLAILNVDTVLYDTNNFNVTFPKSISANGTDTVKVFFRPSHRGIINDTIKICADSVEDTARVSCQGAGIRDSLVVDSTSLNFGKVNVGDSSGWKMVTITNQGNDTTRIDTIRTDNSVFFIKDYNCFHHGLDSAQFCKFDLAFKPNSHKPEDGWAKVKHTGGDTNCVRLSGEGVVPALKLTTHSVVFDTTQLGDCSPPESVGVINTGDGFLRAQWFVPSGSTPYFDLGDTTRIKEALIEPNDTLYLVARFCPPSNGVIGQLKSLRMIVHSNGGIDTVTLQGVAKEIKIRIFLPPDDERNFGSVLVVDSVTRESCFVENINIDSVRVDSIRPFNHRYFEIKELDQPPKVLYPGTRFYFNCTFRPDTSIIEKKVSDVIDAWGWFPDTLWGVDTILVDKDVWGTGVAPLIDVDKDSVPFDSTQLNRRAGKATITIENKGSYKLLIKRIYVSDSTVFPLDKPTLPKYLNNKGDKESFAVDFFPQQSKWYSDTLRIVSNAYNYAYHDTVDTVRIRLSGKGYYVDTLCPEVTKLTMDTVAFDTPAIISANVTDDFSGVKKVELHYRHGNESIFYSREMHNVPPNTFTDTIPKDAVTLAGLEYKISAIDNKNNACTTEVYPLMVRFHPNDTTVHSSFWYTNSPASIDTRWVMLSIPGNLDDKSPKGVFKKALGEPGSDSWRMFYWEEVQHVSQELKSDALIPGRSFWFKCINTSKAFTLDPGSGSTVLTNSAFPIELDSGWNMISNPFFFDLVSRSIFKDTLLVKGPYSYNKRWIWPSDTTRNKYLEPWKGYAVYNYQSKLDTLYLDPHSMAVGTTPEADLPPIDYIWKVKLLVKCGDFVDCGELGSSKSCSDYEDRLDFPKPPDISPSVSVYFPKPNWDRFSSDYATDYRGIINEGASWDFAVDNYTDQKELELSWEGVDSLPSEFEAVLYDQMKNDTINMREKESYSFTQLKHQNPNRFKVFIGRSGYIENEITAAQSAIPKEFGLRQNYPNPFNSGTAISFDLPQGGQVKVKIYNILGQTVLTLYDKLTYPGKYTIAWDGKDKDGKDVSSGIYFYQLSTPGFNKSMKMILLK